MTRPKFNPVLSRPYYSDVADVLDSAVAQRGLVQVYATREQAVNKAHRMNKWRLYNRNAGIFKYDGFVIRQDDNRVTIVPRDISPGQSFTLDGKPIQVTQQYDRTQEQRIMSLGLTQGKLMGEIITEVNSWRRANGITDMMEIKPEDWNPSKVSVGGLEVNEPDEST